MEPRMIAEAACLLGENPLWHRSERRLYWSDITAGRLYRYDHDTGRFEQRYEGARERRSSCSWRAGPSRSGGTASSPICTTVSLT